MDNDGKLIVGVVLTLIVLAISIPWSIAWYHATIVKSAMDSGYEQHTLQGQAGAYWVKAEQ